jgi:recombination protein RecR
LILTPEKNLNTYPSKLLENAVIELSRLPGIGRKTALRLALWFLKQDVSQVESFGGAIVKLRKEIVFCEKCHNISDGPVCTICSNSNRENGVICVVESVRDVMAIENTGQMQGVYHVLGGIISPIEGIGPQDLTIEQLSQRVAAGNITEVMLALPTTIEGDTTNFYLFKRLSQFPVQVTTIARGVSVGDELEYTDEVTLGRSILNRTLFESTMSRK